MEILLTAVITAFMLGTIISILFIYKELKRKVDITRFERVNEMTYDIISKQNKNINDELDSIKDKLK